MDKLISKIKNKGYWKVIIRPEDFKENRITNQEIATQIVENSKIVLRGWDYPHINPEEGIVCSGPDSVSSFCDWPEGGHFEFWKLYLNGQFVHYFSMIEDYQMSEKDKQKVGSSFGFSNLDETSKKYFSIINTLYTITEIFLFAAKLAKPANFGEKTKIILELGNVENRTLFFWGDFFRHLWRAYSCKYQPLVKKQIIQTDALIKNPTKLALDFTVDIFKQFNWKNANKDVFINDQKKLIERRL